MKQKDIALIIIIAAFSAVISLVVSHLLFPSSTTQQQAEIVQPISSSFPTPSSTYFNSSSIDPTQLIQIGNSSNTNPFSGQ